MPHSSSRTERSSPSPPTTPALPLLSPLNQPPLARVLLRTMTATSPAPGPDEATKPRATDVSTSETNVMDDATVLADGTSSGPDFHANLSSSTRRPGYFPHLMIANESTPETLRAARLLTEADRADRISELLALEHRDRDLVFGGGVGNASSNASSATSSRTSSGASTVSFRRPDDTHADLLGPLASSPSRAVPSSSASRPSTRAASRALSSRAIHEPGRSGAAERRQHSRQRRRRRIDVRYESENQTNAYETEAISIVPSSGNGVIGGVMGLTQRGRHSPHEGAITDYRLATKFPTCLVRILSAIHLVICLLVLFVQFYTSAQVKREQEMWIRSLNTYGYMCALLAGLAGCSGIAIFLQQSKNRAICFLIMSVGTACSCCYLLSFYTSYFAEVKMLPSAQGCIERFSKDEAFKIPYACMTFLTLVGFFNSFTSTIVISTVINRARACWWSCDPCSLCQMDDDFDETIEEDSYEAQLNSALPTYPASRFSTQIEMPPAYFERPPPYKP